MVKQNCFKLALVAGVVSLLVGCSSGSDVNTVPLTDAQKANVVASALEGVTLSAIIISDPYADCASVSVGGVAAMPTGTVGRYAAVLTGAPVMASGCVDSVTGVNLPDMRSDGEGADGGGEVVSPITTMIESAKAGGATAQEARARVSAMLGISVADLDKDPVISPAVQKAAAKIVATLEVIKSAGGDGALALFRMVSESDGTKTLDEQLATPAFISSIAPGVPADKLALVSNTASAIATAVNNVSDGSLDAIKQVAAVVVKVKEQVTKIAAGTFTETEFNAELVYAKVNYASIITMDIVAANPVVSLGELSGELLAEIASNPSKYLPADVANKVTNAVKNAQNSVTGGSGGTL